MRNRSKRQGNQSRRGFTLIEVMIAIAIVVALVGIVAVNVVGSRKQAKGGMAAIEIGAIKNALEQFNLAFDRYPTDDEGLAALWSKEALQTEDEADGEKWRKFLKDPALKDQWGNPWNYRAESEHGDDYDLWSNGPDGEEGTADDVVSWSKDSGEGGDSPSGAPRSSSGRSGGGSGGGGAGAE